MLNKQLFNEILKFGSFDDFIDFVIFVGRLRNLSVFNSALIYCQRPGAQWVDTELRWKRRGRVIKPNAIPIVILKPFGPVEFVYEYEDTSGAPVPSLVTPIKQAGIEELNNVNLQSVIQRLNNNYIYFGERPMGERLHGFIELADENLSVEITVKNKKEPYYAPAKYALIVNPNKPVSQIYLNIIHELGHLFCGHLPLPLHMRKDKKGLVKCDRSYLDVNTKEHEAEAVCKIFCERIGIKYDNYEYLEGYRNSGKAPEIDMNAVINATDQICKLLGI